MPDRSTPVSFDDAEMQTITEAARPLPRWMRPAFVAAVGVALRGQPVGAGALFRTCADLQKEFLAGTGLPDLTRVTKRR